MHPVDEFAHVRAQIRRLEARACVLRDAFLAGQAPARSNRHEVQVTEQARRSIAVDRLPAMIRGDPKYWHVSRVPVVSVRELPVRPAAWVQPGLFDPGDDDVVLIE